MQQCHSSSTLVSLGARYHSDLMLWIPLCRQIQTVMFLMTLRRYVQGVDWASPVAEVPRAFVWRDTGGEGKLEPEIVTF